MIELIDRFMDSEPDVRQCSRGAMAGGGTVSYEVRVDGVWVGWVGDERAWLGHRHGGRRWWACWRQDGDTVARWNSLTGGTGYRTRREAVTALVNRVRAAGGPS